MSRYHVSRSRKLGNGTTVTEAIAEFIRYPDAAQYCRTWSHLRPHWAYTLRDAHGVDPVESFRNGSMSVQMAPRQGGA